MVLHVSLYIHTRVYQNYMNESYLAEHCVQHVYNMETLEIQFIIAGVVVNNF